MDAASLAAAWASFSVLVGWHAMPEDPARYEVVVQIDPQMAEYMAGGNAAPLAADVPDDIRPVGRIRVVVGEGALPRERLVVAMRPISEPSSAESKLAAADSAGVELTQYREYRDAASGFDPYAKPAPPGTAGAAGAPGVGSAAVGGAPVGAGSYRGGEVYGGGEVNGGQANPQAALQRATQPIREGVERIDDRLRDAARNFGGRTRQLFDTLGRPINTLADRQQSILYGRSIPYRRDENSVAAGTPTVDSGAASPTAAPAEDPFRRPVGAPANDLRRAGNQNTMAGDDGRYVSDSDERSRDDRDWASIRRQERPWPDVPQRASDDDYQYAEPQRSPPRWDLARRDPRSTTGGGAGPVDSPWPDETDLRFPVLQQRAEQSATPSIDRGMLAAPATAPLEDVDDDRFAAPAEVKDSPRARPAARADAQPSTPWDSPVAVSSDLGSPGAERPSAAALGWDQSSQVDPGQPAGSTVAKPVTDPGNVGNDQQTAKEGGGASTLGLLMAWLLLSGSFAGNVYLFWSYLDVRNKYSSLVRKSARMVGGRYAAA